MKELTLQDEMNAKVKDAKAELVKAQKLLMEEKDALDNAKSQDRASYRNDVHDAQREVNSAQQIYEKLVADAKTFEK